MAKKVPNPNGKKGGEEHQKMVEDVETDIEQRGYKAERERQVRLTEKEKKSRFVDVAAIDDENMPTEFHQIGKQNKDGTPVKRERDAIKDIEEVVGIEVVFHAYNKPKDDNDGKTD